MLTSRSEGIPLVLMEAMAHGKTVLAPAITGIPELVKDGETGFLYRAGFAGRFHRQNRNDSRFTRGAARVCAAPPVNTCWEHFDRKKTWLPSLTC